MKRETMKHGVDTSFPQLSNEWTSCFPMGHQQKTEMEALVTMSRDDGLADANPMTWFHLCIWIGCNFLKPI